MSKRQAYRRLLARIEDLEVTAGAAMPGTVGEMLRLWLGRQALKTVSLRTLTVVRTGVIR